MFSIDKSWNKISVDDLLSKDGKEDELESNQIRYLSARLLYASEFIFDKDNQELSVMIFEMDDVRFLRDLRIGSLRGDEIRVSGEYIIRQDLGSLERYIFDEDRFIIIITGAKNNIMDITEKIIEKYPDKPTKSRLFISDLIPPTITDIVPKKGILTNKVIVSFKVTDNESGIDISSLRLFNLEGFSKEHCNQDKNNYLCSFTPENLIQGTVNFKIVVSDMEGNSNEILSNFIYDKTPVVLDTIIPEQNSYTNSDRIFFTLVDRESGISSVKIDDAELGDDICNKSRNMVICTYRTHPSSGNNIILIETVDEAGNYDILQNTFFYDNDPPEILIKDYSFEIREISGISKISVNEEDFKISGCSIEGLTYYCSSLEKINSIYAMDRAGNEVKEY